MSRIQQSQGRISFDSRAGLVPFFTSGYPDVEVVEALILRADELGAAAIEIGVPYSDSIADGPVIQDSFHSVLQRGYRLADTFALVERIRPSISCGLIAMLSYSIVHRVGTAAFFSRAAEAGFDGVIVPDVPVEEAAVVSKAAGQAGLCFIGLVSPTTSPSRRDKIVRTSSGFIYQIAQAGTTGERSESSGSMAGSIEQLRNVTDLPICVGFGIATADQVREVCQFADGAIVGSAIIRRLAEAARRGDSPEAIVESVSGFLAELAAAAKGGNGRAPPTA